MHIVKKYQTAVTLFQRDGVVRRFASLKEVRQALGLHWISHNVAEHFRTFSHVSWRYPAEWRVLPDGSQEPLKYERVYKDAQYIMRDDAGKPVTYSMFYSDFRKARPWYGYRKILKSWHGEGPVPGTGKSARRRRRRDRALSYINAFRGAVTFYEEGEVAVRPRRAKSLCADPWDEYFNKVDQADRNWKRYRNTQWK